MPVIEAREVSKTYRIYRKPRDWLVERLSFGLLDRARKIKALEGVSLSLDKGRTLGIIGSNGAGKTTLLKVLTGLVRPTSGSVSLTGHVASFLELGSGFHPDFTGRQNVKLNCSILGLDSKQTAALTEQIIAFSELGDAVDDPVRTYSSGMFMRLGFSVAAALKPDILVVDEILSVGDEYFMGKCLDHMNRFKSEGRTIVMVSHDISMVRSLCDEAVLLSGGRMIAHGPPDDVADAYLKSVYEAASDVMKTFSGEVEAPVSGVRRGSGEITIMAAWILDPAGEPTTVLESGKPFSIKIAYRISSPVKDALFGFNIFRSDGILLISTNHTLGASPGRPPDIGENGTAEAVFHCDSMPLLKGHYSLGVSVFHGDRPMPMPIDEILGAVKFEILQGRYREKGTIILPGKWDFKTA